MLFIILSLAAPAVAYTDIVVGQFMYKNIDPIVFPGQYSKSHLHTFFGSDAITINTNTSAELQAGCATAENPNDFSTYCESSPASVDGPPPICRCRLPTDYTAMTKPCVDCFAPGVPTLLVSPTGDTDASSYEPVPIARFTAYYNLGASPAEVAIPQDLKMTAGSATAQTSSEMSANAPNAGVEWFCEGDDAPADKDVAAFPTSTCSTHLQTLLYFPDCVDADTLETGYTDRSYGTTNWCPDGMSRMPQLRFSIRYDLRDVLPDGWSGDPPLVLASGTSFSSHGDFVNGWLPEAAENMVATTEEKYTFAAVDGPNGNDGDGSVCTTTATDADPDNGTSDYATSIEEMSGSSKRLMRRRIGTQRAASRAAVRDAARA
ncbi:hypothetical protein VSDG_07841 [Cytospora chrysosperma]|uniref:DUF1996 domain-containing protein n=1 Tax=Cytospora chrysosperma TaxID=252740 RepID=A0A423VJD0_CYTCH|nr:hypothetical protein VSDG_07841 [Valsa sordida]